MYNCAPPMRKILGFSFVVVEGSSAEDDGGRARDPERVTEAGRDEERCVSG